MRISVTGTSGAGESTLALRLAEAFDLPRIELDAVNWQPDWRPLYADDPAEFARRVDAATAGERWVCDGNYRSVVGPLVWPRATHLVWLDYGRAVIMPRVIHRSIVRAVTGRELWAGTGNRESWRLWLDAGHPIRWAWDTWKERRAETEAQVASPEAAHLRVFRLRRPRDAEAMIAALKEQAT